MNLTRGNEDQAAVSERVASAVGQKGAIARFDPEQMVKVMSVWNVPERHLLGELLDGDAQKLVNFATSASHWK